MKLKKPKLDRKILPNFFVTLYPCVSEHFVTFFEHFDLGEVVYHPIEIFLSDGELLRPERFFVMNLRSQKRCFVLEHTRVNAATRIKDHFWLYEPLQPNDRLAVKRSAIGGADMWFDPILHRCWFLSDRLKQGLKDSKLKPQFRFARCLLVERQGKVV